MNSLVAYSSESEDEVNAESPPRKIFALESTSTSVANSISEEKHTTISTSNSYIENKTSSLPYNHSFSSIAPDPPEIVDAFDEDFVGNDNTVSSTTHKEPEPPRRPSEDNDDDHYTPDDETDIDAALEEGINALKTRASEFPSAMTPNRDSGGESTPRIDSDKLAEETEHIVTVLQLPPSPSGPCDAILEKRFMGYFELKANGKQINDVIKKNNRYKNPAIYEFLVNQYAIDEKGTNFSSKIYDPHSFDENDFYDSLAEYQRKMHEKMAAVEQQQQKTKTASTIQQHLGTASKPIQLSSTTKACTSQASHKSGSTKPKSSSNENSGVSRGRDRDNKNSRSDKRSNSHYHSSKDAKSKKHYDDNSRDRKKSRFDRK